MKKALITGISGQDGHHLSKLLLSKGYEVHGIVRNKQDPKCLRLKNLFNSLILHQGDLGQTSSLTSIILAVGPDEIYNLAALSFVGDSYSNPELTANISGLGALRLFEAVRASGCESHSRIYQASSSEMFGRAIETPQTENTPFHPISPYGVAKTFSHYTALNYKELFGMHISSGILFNHEGEFRDHRFVTRKVSSSVARIALGLQKKFTLGDIQSRRDWGYAGDYVEAMWAMVQKDIPEDYVVATGKAHSVLDFLVRSLEVAGLTGDIEEYVDFDKKLARPAEFNSLVGDASKAEKQLGWKPKVNFDQLVELMVKHDLKIESRAV